MGAVAARIDNRFRAAVFEAGLLGMSIHIGTSPGSWAEGVRKELGDGLPHFLEVISVVEAKNYNRSRACHPEAVSIRLVRYWNASEECGRFLPCRQRAEGIEVV